MKNIFLVFLIFWVIEIGITIILDRCIRRRKIKNKRIKEVLVLSNMSLIIIILIFLLSYVHLSTFYENFFRFLLNTCCFILSPMFVFLLGYYIFDFTEVLTKKRVRTICILSLICSFFCVSASGWGSYNLEKDVIVSTKEEQHTLIYFNNISVSLKRSFEEEAPHQSEEKKDDRITYWYEGENQEAIFHSADAKEVTLHFYDETLDTKPYVKILYQEKKQVKKYRGNVLFEQEPKKSKKIEIYLPEWFKECDL